jgi:hypothetical protein
MVGSQMLVGGILMALVGVARGEIGQWTGPDRG